MVIDSFVAFLVSYVGIFGYVGIFLLMFLESSFFPFPSEVVIIPAGYLVFQGEMSLWAVVLAGILGSIAGSWLNYFLAYRYGRRLILRFSKAEYLEKVEAFFEKHGHISTFNGRLIPIVRQYISFPAGLAKMNPWKFTIYTIIGSGVWVLILALLGFFLGQNEALISGYLREITFLVLGAVVIISVAYVLRCRKR